jgi:hypothetical protein
MLHKVFHRNRPEAAYFRQSSALIGAQTRQSMADSIAPIISIPRPTVDALGIMYAGPFKRHPHARDVAPGIEFDPLPLTQTQSGVRSTDPGAFDHHALIPIGNSVQPSTKLNARDCLNPARLQPFDELGHRRIPGGSFVDSGG